MNRRLARAIADAGMWGFRIKLEYVTVIHQRCARRFLYYLLPPLLVLTACGQQDLPQPAVLPTVTPPTVGPAHFAQESQQGGG